MILYRTTRKDISAKIVKIGSGSYVRIDHALSDPEEEITILPDGVVSAKQASQRYVGQPLQLVTATEDLDALISATRVQLDTSNIALGRIFNDLDFCLHYDQAMRGQLPGWDPYAIRVAPSRIQLYFRKKDCDDYEVAYFDLTNAPLSVLVPPHIPFRTGDAGAQVVRLVGNSDRRKLRTQIRVKGKDNAWLPAMQISEVRYAVEPKRIISRFYPVAGMTADSLRSCLLRTVKGRQGDNVGNTFCW